MFKIYLAKSNRANPDDVANVRNFLAKYSDTVRVVEYTGGKFSHKDMLNCELLVVVPDLSDYSPYDNFVGVGKGLHEQIEAFQSQSAGDNDEYPEILIVMETSELEMDVRAFDGLDIDDSDDYVNYSAVSFDEEEMTFLDVMDTIGLKQNSGGKSRSNYHTGNSSMYLLIEHL